MPNIGMGWTRIGLLCLIAAVLPAASNIEPREVYRARRESLAGKHSDGPIVVFGFRETEAQSSRSAFRQQNDFYYLTGWNEPGATLLLLPKRNGRAYREMLFLPKRNTHREQWTGARLGFDDLGARSATGQAGARAVPL